MKKYNKDWLKNKTVVISGASSGIGKGIAKILITKYNCKVIGIGRNKEKMLNLIEELKENSNNFSYQLFDVSKEENWHKFYDYLTSNNIKIDILINNAGTLPPFSKESNFTIEDVKNTFDVNFFSYIFASKILMPNLLQSNTPAIINMCSSDALCPLVGTSSYSASKGAIKNYTEVMREENKNIYVGLICPGFIKTDIFRNQKQKTSKLIDFFSMDLCKASKKIVKGIKKLKKRYVVGLDAKFMDFMYRHFPKFSLKFFRFVFKKSGINLFSDVFN